MRIAASMNFADTIHVMRRHSSIRLLVILVAAMIASRSAADDAAPARGEVFENVVKVLQSRFYDPVARKAMPELAARYRDQARTAASLDDERNIIGRMLSEIPASHLGLLSGSAHKQMSRNLLGQKSPTFGLELARLDEGFFVFSVLEHGAAARVGMSRGDRVLTIDGETPEASARLDWRSDDASLPDPPIHALIAKGEGDPIAFEIEHVKGDPKRITVHAENDSAYEAAKRSAEVVEVDGRKIAYIHFWFIHMNRMDRLMESLIGNEFKDAEALVLDLRGRGGSADMVTRVLRVIAGRSSKWRRPIVALIDDHTRSAKEMLAYELKTKKLGVLVGQRTAGALLPATFADVGGDSVLMYPAFSLGKYSKEIEGKGVAPDVEANSPLPFSNGADPIRETGMAKAAELAKDRTIAKQPV